MKCASPVCRCDIEPARSDVVSPPTALPLASRPICGGRPGQGRPSGRGRGDGFDCGCGRSMGMSDKRPGTSSIPSTRCFREPLVEASKGGRAHGGARLTPMGEEVLARYRAIEGRAAEAFADELAALDALVGEEPPERFSPHGFVAGASQTRRYSHYAISLAGVTACRRSFAFAAVLFALAPATAWAQAAPNIAAASDLNFALGDIAARYEADTNRKVQPTFGSSRQLLPPDHARRALPDVPLRRRGFRPAG